MGALLEISNIDFEELTRTVIKRAASENRAQGDVLKEELLKKAQNSTDQSMSNERRYNTNAIIAPNEGLDNE